MSCCKKWTRDFFWTKATLSWAAATATPPTLLLLYLWRLQLPQQSSSSSSNSKNQSSSRTVTAAVAKPGLQMAVEGAQALRPPPLPPPPHPPPPPCSHLRPLKTLHRWAGQRWRCGGSATSEEEAGTLYHAGNKQEQGEPRPFSCRVPRGDVSKPIGIAPGIAMAVLWSVVPQGQLPQAGKSGQNIQIPVALAVQKAVKRSTYVQGTVRMARTSGGRQWGPSGIGK